MIISISEINRCMLSLKILRFAMWKPLAIIVLDTSMLYLRESYQYMLIIIGIYQKVEPCIRGHNDNDKHLEYYELKELSFFIHIQYNKNIKLFANFFKLYTNKTSLYMYSSMWISSYIRTLFGYGYYIHEIARVACNGSISHWFNVRVLGARWANIL